MRERSFDAIMLIAFGGPEKPEDIRPFLRHVLAGRPVPPSRIEVNRMAAPSGVKDGWLSYPVLLVMLTGRPIGSAPAENGARKISVSGGAAV